MTPATTYTTREAVAQFPAIVQRVRDGETVIVADEGQPAVEIRLAPGTTREKLLELERDGHPGADHDPQPNSEDREAGTRSVGPLPGRPRVSRPGDARRACASGAESGRRPDG